MFGALQRRLALRLILIAPLLAGPQLDAQELGPEAHAQIRVLLEEKASRSPAQQKMSSDLALTLRRATDLTLTEKLSFLESTLSYSPTTSIAVDIQGTLTAELVQEVEELGARVLNSHPKFGAMRAEVPWPALEAIAALPQVRWLEPAAAFRTERAELAGGADVTEGDVAHNGPAARVQFGVDGTGVQVGAMSDSVDALADLIASGDLPNNVTVLPGQSGNPGSSEGTALLEIVHDLAPGADLFFATGTGGQAQMAQNILDLAAAGCDVIVDDVTYFAEGVFQDDVIAQAVETVTAAGVLYVSSAGNSGNLANGTSGVFEGDYVGVTFAGLNNLGVSIHDYGGGDTANTVTEAGGNVAPFFTLQWAEPLGGATSDYDLFLFDASATTLLKASTNLQNGTQDPFEIIDSTVDDDTGRLLVVALNTGSPRFFHLNTHRGRLEHATDGQVFGHSGALGTISVAAVDVGTAGGGPFTGGPANPVEFFSSDGPRRIFFESDGTPAFANAQSESGVVQSVVRAKPDVTAANRVSTNTPNFEFFAGTSASAPHVAGLLALLAEQFPDLTRAGLEFNFFFAALDVEDEGRDNLGGQGIPLADKILEQAMPGVSSIVTEAVETSEEGDMASFDTVLNARPTADVTFTVGSGDPSEGSVVPQILTFQPDNWDMPQTVTVLGVDDDVDDGDVVYDVTFGTTTSSDPDFDQLTVEPVPVNNADNDTAGVSVPEETLETDETGTTDTFTVTLDSEPIFDVNLDIRSGDTTEGLVSDDGIIFQETISLMFTPSNWDTPQTVTVQGQDDDIFSLIGDGDVTYQVFGSDIQSLDPIYDALDPAQISVTVINRAKPLFTDDFESGDLSAWTTSVP